jgi:nucleotide-binding universal stress UspA family protein
LTCINRVAGAPHYRATVQTPERQMFSNILVGIDGSKSSKRAAVIAVALAAKFGSRLHAMAVWEEGSYGRAAPAKSIGPKQLSPVRDKAVEEALRRNLADVEAHAGKHGVGRVKLLVERGQPAQKLLNYAKRGRIDLIVLGNRGVGGLERVLLGGTADRVLHLADCPCLVAR